MALGQIFGALHLLEAADGALELEASVAIGIKAVRLGISRGELATAAWRYAGRRPYP